MDDVADLMGYLAPQRGEVIVISTVSCHDRHAHRLLRGSVLVGPEAIGQTNWHGWQLNHAIRPIGESEPDSAAYATTADELRTSRTVTDVGGGMAWVQQLVDRGVAEPLDTIPHMRAELRPPTTPLRISPRLQTDASTFVTGAVRPGAGFLLRGPDIEIQAPMMWESDGDSYINSPLSAGLILTPGQAGGLVLARLERRAWFTSLRAGENFETFDCQIGIEPERIDIADLAVSLDEWVDDELVHAQQVRLEEVDVDHVRGHSNVSVRLPTLGRRVERSARLHSRNGTLLDASRARFSVLEAINVQVGVIGGGPHTVPLTMGERAPVPAFVERADAVGRVSGQYDAMFATGADAVLLQPGVDVRAVLANRLGQARGTLRIVDRYFGKAPADWAMLGQVSAPVEVLTSFGVAPPAGAHPALTVRWITGRRPPFHGRGYLWEDGGFSVDSSPDGFGRDAVLVQPLAAAVSQRWQQLFAGWWQIASATP